MTDVLDENISEKCPKCGGHRFKKFTETATGWKKIIGLLLALASLTHPKYDNYKTVCADCGFENKW